MSLFRTACIAVVMTVTSLAAAVPDHWTSATAAELQAPAKSYFRLDLRYPGVYRVGADQLAVANNGTTPILETLTLANNGSPVPFYRVRDPLTSETIALEFVADAPRDSRGRLLHTNRSNIFHLIPGKPGPEYQDAHVTSGTQVLEDVIYRKRLRREHNVVFAWTAVDPEETDNFYWHFYQAASNWSGRVFLDFYDYASQLRMPVQLGLRLLGENQTPQSDPDHKFDVAINDTVFDTFSFDGIRMYDFETSIPTELIKKNSKLSFKTPEDRMQAIDRVGLDALTVTYPAHITADGQLTYWFSNELLETDLPSSAVRVKDAPPGSKVFDIQQQKVYTAEGDSDPIITMDEEPTSYVLVGANGSMPVDGIVKVDATESLLAVPQETRALVIYHPRTRQSAKALAAYRNEQGLSTLAVDVTEVFDRLNDGFISDVALKRYIRYVADQAPQLEFIVLFGDSTFDFREARHFYTQHHPTVLIPIHWVSNPSTTWSGGFQDDNWYGAFNDEYRPDIAVGRIPANNDDNGMAYLRKIIEHEQLRKSADAQALMLSSYERSFQDMVREPGTMYNDRFSSVTFLFPESSEADKEVQRLMDEFTTGAQLVYYVGHGGAMVWRVGPADFKKQKDLFTPTQVRQLEHPGVYPFVLCSSCYTTSYDQELGIGESLLFQPQGGAISVIGSPWKATVHEGHNFNRRLIDEYFKPENARIGQAMLQSLRANIAPGRNQPAFNSFTLLGDPCIEIVRKP